MKFLFFILFLVPTLTQAEIYKWVDDKGRVHFGDSPRKEDKAERVVVDVISYEYVKVENIEFFERDKKTSSTKVEMFSTAWCGYCKKARQYFNDNNIDFVEYDIDKDKSAHKRFKALGGKGVPVILVGNNKMSGFDVRRFESLYQ